MVSDGDEESGPVIGSGSFLADRGYPDPEGMRDRILAANAIALRAGELGLSADALAARTGLTPDEARLVLDGRVRSVPRERLDAASVALATPHAPGTPRHRVYEASSPHDTIDGHDASDELLPERERVSAEERAVPNVRWLVEGPELGHEARRKRIGFRRTRRAKPS